MGCWYEGYEVVGVEEGHAGVDLKFEKKSGQKKEERSREIYEPAQILSRCLRLGLYSVF